MATSVTVRLQVLVRQPEIERYTRGRFVVQRSELTKVATRLFRTVWRITNPDHIDLSVPLSRDCAARVDAVIDDIYPRLVEVAAGTAALLQRIARLAAERGALVGCDAVSGRATSAASSHLIHGGILDDRSLDTLAERILDKVLRATNRMTSKQFAMVYAEWYEKCWRSSGAASITTFQPRALLLGADQRPDLEQLPGHRDNDISGTDRCVYRRYRLIASATGRSAPADDQVADLDAGRVVDESRAQPSPKPPYRSGALRCRQTETPLPPGRDLGLDEVERACQPYGLADPGHRATLRGVHNGVHVRAPNEDPGLTAALRTAYRAFSRTCLTLTADLEPSVVAQAVAGLLRYQLAPEPRPTADTPAPTGPEGLSVIDMTVNARTIAAQPDAVTLILVRRSWLAALSLEQRSRETMWSCSLIACLRTALQRAVPHAVRHHRVSSEVDMNRYAAGPLTVGFAPDDTTGARRHAALLTATSGLLMTVGDARRLLLLEPGWRARYVQLVTEREDTYLSPTDFRLWCLDTVPGVRTDTDEDGE